MSYLLEHPDAQDTLEGITHWWLLERKIRYESAIVKKALDELVKGGLVIENKGRGSAVRYRINLRNVAVTQMLSGA